MAKNTIYIVGAGASFEVGLPVGNSLKTDIARILRMEFQRGTGLTGGNYDLYQAIVRHVGNHSEELRGYIEACRHIINSMPLAISIDNFIDSERGNEKLALCGKVAITEAILSAERRSKIYFQGNRLNSTINFSNLEGTWYLPFFRTLTENCRAEDLPERLSSITLVIFNYDRCIEQFLHHALMTYYRLSSDRSADIIGNLTIIHPYGVVGVLPWQDRSSLTPMDYGGEIQAHQLIEYSKGIRTFTEGAHSDPIENLKSNMKNAERLVFLGFAFHRLNMTLLSLSEVDQYDNSSLIDCYATAYEASKSDQDSIRRSITHLYKGRLNVNIENMTCAKLFQNYSRSLGYA